MQAFACLMLVSQTLVTWNIPANLSLGRLFGDHMVLQRGKPIPVWGTAAPREAIAVSLGGRVATGRADARGDWSVRLPAMKVAGPHELTVRGSTASITLSDVLIGDVWVCSGQSNMGVPMAGSGRGILDGEKEIAAANYPDIRLFAVTPTIAATPQGELTAHTPWMPCTPQSVLGFSAVGYFFGRHVHTTQKVPVGLVMSAWGGTYAEAWTSKAGLAAMPEFAERLRATEAALPRLQQIESEYLTQVVAWEKQMDALDAGVRDGVPQWSRPAYPTTDWGAVTMPLPIAMLAGTTPSRIGGRVWLRRDVELPAAWRGRDSVLNLGLVRETCRVWFNGEEVRRSDLVYRFWDGQTIPIPGRLVVSGPNSIVVRVTDAGGMGGAYGDPGPFCLSAASPSPGITPVSVAGPWLIRQGVPLDRLAPRPAPPSYWPNNPNMPTVLYNAMIHPLARMPIRGVIWYQGESNTAAAYEYRRLFPALIRDWRRAWNLGDLPFLFVQIANFSAWQPPSVEPRESTWAELREAQSMALSVPKTAMAVAIDIGDVDDVHPINKRDVGVRLGLAAQAVAYGETLEFSGPLYRSMAVRGGRATVSFTHAAGLTANGGTLRGFAVAGSDRKFVNASAAVEGDKVVVWNDGVKSPAAVRYGWDYAPECNLYNGAGLPASPFRTDRWPGITEPKKDPGQ